MARPIVLSNGSMLVGLNRFGEVHDFFYPYVGLENHDTARDLRHRIGVYVDGKLTWLDDNDWQIEMSYMPDTLIGKTIASNPQIGVQLDFTDAVDHDHDVLMRHATVKNLFDKKRIIQLAFHQVFNISNTLSGDTAQYIPQEKAILHYSGYRNFVVRAMSDQSESFDQFSVGLCGIEGKDGTYVDAEDGQLEGNPVEYGSVDSTISCHLGLAAQGSGNVFYWVACGNSREAALLQSQLAGGERIYERFNNTAKYWKDWVEPGSILSQKVDEGSRDRINQSLLLIKAHIDRRGSIIASSDTAVLNYSRAAYTYCWPRDAVNALIPLVRLGYTKEAVRFFDFCRLTLQQGGYLMHKYQPDGSVGSSWHPYIHNGQAELPIQEDETAAVVYLMSQYYKATGDAQTVKRLYGPLIKPMATFMAEYIDSDTGLPHASYDLWEERFATHTYTVALTQAALDAAAELAQVADFGSEGERWSILAADIRQAASQKLFNDSTGYFYRSVYNNPNGDLEFDDTVDSATLYGAWAYKLVDIDDPRIEQSAKTLLKTFNIGDKFEGIPRYYMDRYNALTPDTIGNPWFITSLWLAQYYIEKGDTKTAEKIIKWTESRMIKSGVLAEQFDPKHPDRPISVAPLVWSQAEYLSTVISLAVKCSNAELKDLIREQILK